MSIPPKAAFAAEARRTVERHDEWDGPHSFVTFAWEPPDLVPHTVVMIDPAIDPHQYPELMRATALEDLAAHPAEPPYAFMLTAEAWGASPPAPGASADEAARFDAAARDRTFHELPGSVEAVHAWIADVHGRLWHARAYRIAPGMVEEFFYPPGRSPGGYMLRDLLAVGTEIGALGHGLPPIGVRVN